MLAHPEAFIAQRFAMLRDLDRVANGAVLRRADDGGRLVENGEPEIGEFEVSHGAPCRPSRRSGWAR